AQPTGGARKIKRDLPPALSPGGLLRDRRAPNLSGGEEAAMRGWVWAVVALLAAPAWAQLETTGSITAGDTNWTATAARTVGNNNGVVQVEAGWPGVGFTYLKGMDDRTDLGLHVGLNYGLEG